jgi:hypothetical protein
VCCESEIIILGSGLMDAVALLVQANAGVGRMAARPPTLRLHAAQQVGHMEIACA